MKNVVLFINKIFKNKVFFYISTRYFTYAIQFLFTFFVAYKLGPYNFGIWSFILLIMNYFSLLNFGISNSINILLVQNKSNDIKNNNLIKTSLILTSGVCVLIILFTLYYYLFDIPYFNKYSLINFFYLIAIIAIITHFNNLFITIFRVKNDVFKIAFYQSIIPILCFITFFIGNKDNLIMYLLIAYLIGNILSILLFFIDKRISYKGEFSMHTSSEILNKGLYLFIYNTAFYFVMISTKTIISYYYKVEEYGFFSFTYTLSNSILLLLNAFTFIIFPKLIDKLSSRDNKKVQNSINFIRDSYITLAHFLMYCIIAGYPVILLILPKYTETNTLFHLMALTMLMTVNVFGYSTYLMAQNKEKLLGKLALFALLINIGSLMLVTTIFRFSYDKVILSTLFSYFIYAILLTLFANKNLFEEVSIKSILINLMPLKLLIPFIFSFIIAIFEINNWINLLCLGLFIKLNFKELNNVIKTFKKVLNKPNIINI